MFKFLYKVADMVHIRKRALETEILINCLNLICFERLYEAMIQLSNEVMTFQSMHCVINNDCSKNNIN